METNKKNSLDLQTKLNKTESLSPKDLEQVALNKKESKDGNKPNA